MTVHINAEKESIAKKVIMPGDPLRAKYIADNFLTGVQQVNDVRGMTAYTGSYKNKIVTVFPSGMGIPSMGIYSYELFNFYDVDKIIRIGTCGSYEEDVRLGDLIVVNNSYTNSNYSKEAFDDISYVATASGETNVEIVRKAREKSLFTHIGNINCSEAFYGNPDMETLNIENRILGEEMESFALFCNAKHLKKQAACILTVSDNLITKERMSSEDREKTLNNMILLALESI